MVATSLPFWMQRPSRSMVPFLADETARLGVPSFGAGAIAIRPAASVLAGGLVVTRCAGATIEEHADAWAALARRALEPNVFMEPAFALPAARHVVPALRPSFVLCWDHRGAGEPRLIGLLALQSRRWPALLPVAMAWHHPQGVVSAPLLDRDTASEALEAMLAALAARIATRGGLMLRGIPRDGALMRLLAGAGRRSMILSDRTRAVLPRADAAAENPKRAKERRRQLRRLAEEGAPVLRSARSVDEVRAATERFLDLEARGWKGARGTAMLKSPRLATFTRTMTRLMARQGLCRIDTLEVGGEAVAIGIVLRSGDRAYFWKTAYDEARARRSPGKLLAAALSELQQADEAVAVTDSCAIPDHPLIDALWKDRIVVADVLVTSPVTSRPWVVLVTAGLRTGLDARLAAKRVLHAVKSRLGRR